MVLDWRWWTYSHVPGTGTIGHVAHGKSTVVKAISGVHTVRFKNELVRNITIKLGYANAKVRFFEITYKQASEPAVDLQMRKRGLSSTRMLQVIQVR